MPKSLRQQLLFQAFKFNCDCEACVNNFPTFNELPVYDDEMYSHQRKDVSQLSVEVTMKEFRENCDYIEKNFNRYPCKEVLALQFRNILILTKFAMLHPSTMTQGQAADPEVPKTTTAATAAAAVAATTPTETRDSVQSNVQLTH